MGKRLWRLLLASGMSFGLNIGLTFCLVEGLSLNKPLAYGITLIMVFGINFAVLRLWVYRDRSDDIAMASQLKRCAIVSVTSRIVEWTIFTFLVEVIAIPYILAITLVQIVIFSLKFLIYDRWVFNPRAP